jgi:hypothetical protein
MPPAVTPAAPGRPGGRSPLGWLKTREGKITAGAAAVLAVVILALRRSTTGGGGTASLVPSGDQTLADRLDQVGMTGGTLEGLISSSDALAGSVDQLRDLIEAGNPLPSTKPPIASAGTRPLASGARRLPSGTVVVDRAVGRTGQTYNLRKIAAQYSVSQNPNAIESTLRGLIRLNPSLKGKRTIPGGLRIIVPDPRYYKP